MSSQSTDGVAAGTIIADCTATASASTQINCQWPQHCSVSQGADDAGAGSSSSGSPEATASTQIKRDKISRHVSQRSRGSRLRCQRHCRLNLKSTQVHRDRSRCTNKSHWPQGLAAAPEPRPESKVLYYYSGQDIETSHIGDRSRLLHWSHCLNAK